MGDLKRLEFAKSRAKDLTPGIGKNCSIDPDVVISKGAEIHDNVVIRGHVFIGDRCLIKSGAVIGEKGFSFERDGDKLIRVEHTGGVLIGDDVEIGSHTTVVQGTVYDTILESQVKLDDHVHVAHNCYIGKRTQISAGTILAGSVTVGQDCWFGLNSTVRGGFGQKTVIGDGAFIGVGAVVLNNVLPGDVVVGNPARVLRGKNV